MKTEFNKSAAIESPDSEDIPQLPLSTLCPACGIYAAIVDSDVMKYNNILGYQFWRLRIRTKCGACGKITVYRIGGEVVKNGKMVRGID